MDMQYAVRAEKPFPAGFGGDRTGSFVEEDLSALSKYRYTTIYPTSFDPIRLGEFSEQGVSMFEAYPLLRYVEHLPKEEFFWIYELQRFVVEKQNAIDSEILADNAEEFCRWVFVDFNHMLKFCLDEFGIKFEDFKYRWQTHYPD